jgi:hypothetical protein
MALLAGQSVTTEQLPKESVVQQSPKPTKNQQDIAYIQDDLFGGS